MKFTTLKGLFFGLTTILLASSCTSDDDYVSYPYPDVAFGVIVNASPNSGDLYFYADANLVNTNGVNYAEAYGYYSFFPGERVLKIKDGAGTELATNTVTLTANQYFTAFAVNTFENIELVTFNDSLVQPGNNHARVKFINLSPDAGTINISTGTQTVVTALEFKHASEFIELQSGTYNFGYSHTTAGTDQEDLFTDTGVELHAGRIYTIYTKGFVYPGEGSNDGFSTEKLTLY